MALGAIARWSTVVVYMAAIAVVSHQPNLTPPAGTSDWVWHVAEFAVLAALLLRAMTAPGWRVGARTAAAAILVSVVYAITDEIHQSFVPGRTASVKDVLADTAGAGLVVAAVLLFGYRRRRGDENVRSRIDVTLFGRKGCHLCDEAEAVLGAVASDYPIRIEKIDVDGDADLAKKYGETVPVVAINGRKWAKLRIDPAKLRRKLDSMTRETEDD